MSFFFQFWYDPPGSIYVYVDGSRDRAWSQLSHAEGALVVVEDHVRTTAHAPLSGPGREYTLDGTATGVTFQAAIDVYDAGTDGEHIYAWRWSNAQLVRYTLEWTDPEVVFSLPLSPYSQAYMGITFDPGTESVWLSSWYTASFSRLDNYSMSGELLGSIDLDGGHGAGLALDHADGTLWFYDWSDGRYEQYATDGEFLGTMEGMTRIYGAEFKPPDG